MSFAVVFAIVAPIARTSLADAGNPAEEIPGPSFPQETAATTSGFS